MRTFSPILSNALFSKVRQCVLALLYGQPDRSFHTNEIIWLTHSGTGAAQRELQKLASVGLIMALSWNFLVYYVQVKHACTLQPIPLLLQKVNLIWLIMLLIHYLIESVLFSLMTCYNRSSCESFWGHEYSYQEFFDQSKAILKIRNFFYTFLFPRNNAV